MKYSLWIVLAIVSLIRMSAQELALSGKIVLKDQFEKAHALEFPTEQPMLMAVADHAASEPMKQWIEWSKREFGTRVIYTGVADVRAVPALLRSFVRKKFKSAYTHPVLLDWSGSLIGGLQAKAGVPNVYLLSREGKILATESGAVTKEKLQRLTSAMNALGLEATSASVRPDQSGEGSPEGGSATLSK